MASVMRWMVACVAAAFFTTAGAQQEVCKQDVDKLCKGVEPGEGRILRCLKKNEKKLSPSCATYFKQVQQELKKVSKACEPDVERFCWKPPVEPVTADTPVHKPGSIVSCLKDHSDQLSAGCKDSVAKAKATVKPPAQPKQ